MHGVLREPLTILIAQTIAVVGMSRLLGLFTRRIRQPLVIAEIMAGIALGPSLLGWLVPSLSKALFPPSSFPALGLISQVGLILFMFLVGLEFDPRLLKGRGHTSIVISHTSIILPFALGSVLALWAYKVLSSPSVPFSSFTLFMGAAMSITAFPVLARILVERRLLRTQVGSVTITCAAVDDVTAWCILAFVVGIARAHGVGGAIVTTGLALAYIAVMLFVVRPLLSRIASRSSTREVLSQNRVAVVLIFVLLSAASTELIGIHALFGAFILGAAIPKEGGFSRLLAEKIEDVVVVLLLPLFFAYSGLRTQIGLLQTGTDWALCGLIILVACAGKFGGSAVAARLTGLRWREASALGILMNTRGLMELIVLNIGLDLGVISPKLFTMMVLMALITTFMTSPLLEWIYPLSELTRDLVKEPVIEPPPAPALPAYTVMMCVSDPRSGPGMVRVGKALAGTQLYALQLLRATERISLVLDEAEKPAEDRPSTAAQPLGPLLGAAQNLGVAVRPLSFVSAAPASDICSIAGAKRADLVILGWHRALLGSAALGGVVHDVMENAPSQVGILVERGLEKIERVLVPYKGGEHDAAALRIAHRLAQASGVAVTILHVVAPESAPTGEVDRRVIELTESSQHGDFPIQVKIVQSSDPARAAVEESSKGYDLVVIAAGSQWRFDHRPFGMGAEFVLKHCPISLLIVHDASLVKSPAAERSARIQPVDQQHALRRDPAIVED